MGPTTAADRVSLIHRAWRLLPANARVRFIRRAGAWLAPTIEPGIPMASAGIAVGGEFSNASGMGESARLMHQALTIIGVPNWSIDTGSPWHLGKIRPAASVLDAIPRQAPLMLHVNAPMLPLVMCRLPRTIVQQRRIIGFWNWELPVVSHDWIIGARFVHAAWVASRFTAAALEPVLPGRVRVVPYPLALVPPRPSALDRAAFGLPDGAVVILVSFNLASSMARKNPMAAIAAFRVAFGDRPDRILLMKVGHPHHFPAEFARLAASATGPNIRLETWNLSTADNHALIAAAISAVAASKRGLRPGAGGSNAAGQARDRDGLVRQHRFHGRRQCRLCRLPPHARAIHAAPMTSRMRYGQNGYDRGGRAPATPADDAPRAANWGRARGPCPAGIGTSGGRGPRTRHPSPR
jgi:hypothetical protein